MPAPSLALLFADTRTLPTGVSFTRTTEAWYWEQDGMLRWVPANTPRFVYDPLSLRSIGLLVEEARTNYITYSNDFLQSSWTKLGCEVFSNFGPWWQYRVPTTKVVENTSNGQHGIATTISGLADNTVVTLYVEVAPAGRSQIQLNGMRKDGIAASAVFTLVGNGSYSSLTNAYSASIRGRANGFYQCELTFDTLTGATTPYGQVLLYNGGYSYTGNGFDGIYLAHAQLETNSEASSPILTTGSTKLRNTDSPSITGTNFSSWFNAAEGTLLVEGRAYKRYANTSQIPFLVSISDGTSNNRMYIGNGVQSTYTDARMVVTSGGVTQANNSTLTEEPTNIWLLGYKANDFAFVGRGSLLYTSATGSVPSVNRMDIGKGAAAAGNVLNGTIARILYWSSKIDNTLSPQLTTRA
jgi:hypothetical protein